MPRQNQIDQPKKQEELNDVALVLRTLLAGASKLSVSEVKRRFVGNYQAKTGPVELVGLENVPALVLHKGAPIRVGGGGIVIRCANRDLPSVRYALKIARPSLYTSAVGKEALAEQHLNAVAEYQKHGSLSHQNVARVFAGNFVNAIIDTETGEMQQLPAFLMEWLDDPTPLSRFLVDRGLNHHQTIDVISQALLGLEHIHGASLIHWDIKSDNILVDAAGVVKVVDLGNARRTDKNDRGLIAYSTKRNLPPILWAGKEDAVASSRRTPVELPSLEWDAPWLDLWMLARDLNQVFLADESLLVPGKGEMDEAEVRRFLSAQFLDKGGDGRLVLSALRLMIRRLLKPTLPNAPRFYNSARAVVDDLTKLTPEFGAAQSVPELGAVPQAVMRLPVTGNFPYSRRLGKLFNSQVLQRLGKHLQLGTLVQVYPGASHRRIEHVAGVAAMVTEFVRSLYSDRTSPFWRLSIEARDVDALLFGAMIHDIGHVAFGHFLEEMRGFLANRVHEGYAQQLLDPRRAGSGERVCDPPASEREELLRLVREDWLRNGDYAETFLAYVAQILHGGDGGNEVFDDDAELVKESADRLKLQILHSILDSSIDADKLDYLLRDSHHCGIKYAEGIDCDRFFQSLTTISLLPGSLRDEVLVRDGDGARPAAGIGVSEKGTLPVESILLARYQLFGSVYWQHTARCATAMLQYLVQEYVGACRKEDERSGRLDRLVDRFRNRSDREALEWLRRQFEEEVQPERRSLLLDMCDGLLGKREALYWPVFELRYQRPRDGDRMAGSARKVFDTLREASDRLSRASSTRAFLRDVRRLRQQVGTRLTKELAQRTGEKIRFAEGEVLLDIPPAGMDQVGNIFVVTERGVKPIQQLSPVVDAIGDVFTYWARKIRLFISPRAGGRCQDLGIGQDTLHEASWEALQWIVQKGNPQLFLFGSVPRRRNHTEDR